MEKQKVSVVIPLYNVEAYIGRCLDSVLSQSYENIEIIVVDDCGQDRSVEIVEQYCGRHPAILLIHHDRNRGLMTTRRDGYMAATGDFIVFLDSDDALPHDAVASLVAAQQLAYADIVLGDLLKHRINGTVERVVGSLDYEATKTEILEALIDYKVNHSLCGKLYRREMLQKGDSLTFDNLTVGEDGCLFYQLLEKAGKIVSFGGIVYDYYENKESSTLHAYGIREVESIIISCKVMETVCGRFPELEGKLRYRLCKVLFTLFSEQVPAKEVRALLGKHGLAEYGKLSMAINLLRPKDYWFFIKRFVYVRTMLKKCRHNNAD